MKTTRIVLALLAALAASATVTAEDTRTLVEIIQGKPIPGLPAGAVQLDPKRIINETNSFLKEREPEMTAEEYALYERVITMISTNVPFALRMLEAMMDEKEPPSPAFEFILGNVYYAADQIDDAERSYRNAVRRYPEFLRAWVNLGVLCYSAGRFAEATPCFSRAVVLGDRDPQTFGLLGFCLEKEGNVVSAEMSYMQALSGDPGNPDWKEGLLRIYIEGKQFGRAESLVTNLIKERPTEARLWLTHASVMISQGRKVEAAVLLETAAGIGVAGPGEIVLLGDIYSEQKLAPEAMATYAKALGSAPVQGEEKLLQLAHALIASNKLPDAEKALGMLEKELSPQGQLGLLQCRADLSIARKRWPEARAQVEALLKLAPLDGKALLTLGRTHAEEGDLPRAMLAFEAALQIPGSAYRASLELASIELRNRRYEKCVEYLEHALSIHRTDTVEDYLARVRSMVGSGGSSG